MDKLQRDREYHRKNRDRLLPIIRERSRIWYEKNKDRHLSNGRKRYSVRKEEGGEEFLIKKRFGNYRRKSKKDGFPFPFDYAQFCEFIKRPCFYCGSSKAGGIDRLDNQIKGYYIENIMPCCGMCNRMKNKFGMKEFLEKCRCIIKYHSYELKESWPIL